MWYVLAEFQYMARRKCPSVNRVRSDLPVTSRSKYDAHTSARVDVGPSKENYSSTQWSNTVITQLSEAYCNVLFFMHTWVCMSLFMYAHVRTLSSCVVDIFS